MDNRTRIREEEVEEEEIRQQMTGMMSKLPLDIVFDILSRLPIKSLSECRWVSKSWYKIIKNPRFATTQLAFATQNCSPCLTYFQRDFQAFYPVDPQAFENHETSITVPTSKLTGLGGMFEVVGSCNGLVCMSPDRGYNLDPYYVCNPITGVHVILPEYPKSEEEDEYDPCIFGFGFDPITNDYKFLHITRSRQVHIFTLGSDNWRRGASDYPEEYIGQGKETHTVFFNGALHWVVSVKEAERERFFIVAFSIATEQFQEIPLPLCFRQGNKRYKPEFASPILFFLDGERRKPDLVVLGQCLCLVDVDAPENTEIWMMKSYGDQGSWCKEYVLRKKIFSGYGRFQMEADEVIKLINGELVVAKSMHYYNPQTNVYTSFETHGLSHHVCDTYEDLQAIAHAGTLISPKNIGRSTKSSPSGRQVDQESVGETAVSIQDRPRLSLFVDDNKCVC